MVVQGPIILSGWGLKPKNFETTDRLSLSVLVEKDLQRAMGGGTRWCGSVDIQRSITVPTGGGVGGYR